MEIKEIDKTCSFCGDEAVGIISYRAHTLALCGDCAKALFWELAHADYVFVDEK